MGPGVGGWVLANFGFWSNFVAFLVEFIPLARIDGIVLIVNRFGAFGGQVQRQEHCGVEI